MLARHAAALPLIVFLAGCGGSKVPDGMPIAVRIEFVPSAQIVGRPGVPSPQALTVHNFGVGWDRVSSLLPETLPEPVDQGGDCYQGQVVSVRFSTKEGYTGEVDYGPCRWPASIEPVRLLMGTFLRRGRASW